MTTPAPNPDLSPSCDHILARAVRENAHSLALLLAPDGRILDLNQHMADRLGQPWESLKGTLLWPHLPSESRALHQALVQRVLAERKPHRYDTAYAGRWYDSSLTPCLDFQNQVIGVAIVAWDITERKQAEQQIRMLKHSIDMHYDGAYWMDSDNRFVYVNDIGCQALGYTREELIGKPLSDINVRATPERMDQVWEALRKHGHFAAESVHRRKDGSEFPVEIIASYVHFGGREYNCGFARDITQRKQAEQQLRESEALYQSLVNCLPQCVFRKNLEGRFTFANPHFCQLLGKTPAEILGRTDFDFFPRDLAEKYRRDDQRVQQERRVCEQAEEHAPPDGKKLVVQVVKTPLVNDAGQIVGVQGIFWDITERKRTEQERERLIGELKAALAQVRTLGGLLPICAGCKKIRDDQGYWNQVESYLAKHTDATFTHGLCPECLKKYYPELE